MCRPLPGAGLRHNKADIARVPSAGLLMYRRSGTGVEVFLVHPGGPYFAKKDEGVWSVPKGEIHGDEEPFQTALREFQEETGITPDGDFIPLGGIRQRSDAVQILERRGQRGPAGHRLVLGFQRGAASGGRGLSCHPARIRKEATVCEAGSPAMPGPRHPGTGGPDRQKNGRAASRTLHL